MNKSTLDEHKFNKGQFIPPFINMAKNLNIEIGLNSWCKDRLPETLWLALIYSKYERKIGLEKAMQILDYIKDLNCNIKHPYFSLIIKLSAEQQVKIFDFIKNTTDTAILSPLTIIFPYSEYPFFAKLFYSSDTYDCRKKKLLDCLMKFYSQQDECTTDIRYLILYYGISIGYYEVNKKTIQDLSLYVQINHTDERMKTIRPIIRSIEAIDPLYNNDNGYINNFWEKISNMTECQPFYIKYDNSVSENEIKDIGKLFDDTIKFYAKTYQTIKPLDNKMLVLNGILTYSYKRFFEIIDHNLFNTIAGRSIIRVLIEDYIMIKYLIKEEAKNPNIWIEYQSYGIGQLKLIEKRFQKLGNNLDNSHVNYDYIELIVNDYIDEEFLSMDTRYFDNQNIRLKADRVGEKDLFGLYYDYDSSFEHGLWGAIRECALLKCNAAGHQYHCIPDCNKNQKCKSIWHDSVAVLLKTIKEVSNIYSLSDELEERVASYENKYSI